LAGTGRAGAKVGAMSNPTPGATRRAALSRIAATIGAATVVPAMLAPAQAATGAIVPSEYTAHKGAVNLYMYRKRLERPGLAGQPAPVLFLIHGSSFCGRSTYDLQVPGNVNYSMMDAFANYGFDVWTIDCENYGRSSRTNNNSDIASGVEDIKAGMDVITRETGHARAHLFGESSGGIRVTAFAVKYPALVDRIAMSAYTYTGKGSETLGKRAENVEFYRTHSKRPETPELLRSVFTRDKVGTSDPAVGDALVKAEAQYDGTLPTGTYLDMVTKLPIVDPTQIHAPVLLTRGEYDGIATTADLVDFFVKLPNQDKQFVIIPGAAHTLGLALNHDRFFYALNTYLTPPPRMDKLG
jgi:pimeloyl-ACP methyl ester carboxylesterase